MPITQRMAFFFLVCLAGCGSSSQADTQQKKQTESPPKKIQEDSHPPISFLVEGKPKLSDRESVLLKDELFLEAWRESYLIWERKSDSILIKMKDFAKKRLANHYADVNAKIGEMLPQEQQIVLFIRSFLQENESGVIFTDQRRALIKYFHLLSADADFWVKRNKSKHKEFNELLKYSANPALYEKLRLEFMVNLSLDEQLKCLAIGKSIFYGESLGEDSLRFYQRTPILIQLRKQLPTVLLESPMYFESEIVNDHKDMLNYNLAILHEFGKHVVNKNYSLALKVLETRVFDDKDARNMIDGPLLDRLLAWRMHSLRINEMPSQEFNTAGLDRKSIGAIYFINALMTSGESRKNFESMAIRNKPGLAKFAPLLD
jgi:hypothetical protein